MAIATQNISRSCGAESIRMSRTTRAAGAARRPRRTLLPLAFAFFLFLAAIAGPQLHAASAAHFFKRAQAAEAAENYDLAFENYQAAFKKNPKDLRYKTAYYRMRGTASGAHYTKAKQLEQSGDDQTALVELLRAAEIDSSNEAVTQEIAAVRERQKKAAEQPRPQPQTTPQQSAAQQELNSISSPIQLKPSSNEIQALRMTEDTKTIYQAIGRAAGVNVLFDPDYTSKRIQVDLTGVSLMDALRIVGIQSNTFWRAVTPNTIFVAANTPAKRRDLEEQAVQTFYLTNATQANDLTDATAALRNVLGTNVKAFSIASQNAIIVRGTPDELLLAQKIVGDVDKAMPEVVVDIAIMEVSKNWERTLGIEWPGSVGVAITPATSTTTDSTTTTTTSTTPTLYNLANLNSNDVEVTMGSATANLLLTDTNTKILQNPRLRATNLQKATMKIGQQIPIATGSFSSGVGTSTAGLAYAQTQFQYQDIGVNIEITPTIHANGDVTLKLKIEDKSLGGNETISGVTEPIFVQKTSEQTIRLREGEVSILGGILENSDSTSWSGIPGLSSIPLLRYIFGSKDHTITSDELVFMLVPHIVRGSAISDANLRPIDTGTGQSVQLRRVPLPLEGSAANAPPVVQTGVATTTISSTTPPSAASGAPAALEAMRRSADGAMNAVPQAPGPRSPVSAPQQSVPAQPVAQPANQPPSVRSAGLPPVGSARFLMTAPGPVNTGATFQVPVVISGASDVASVPLQVRYDASKLALVNVAPGDFLTRDGQAVNPVHRDDGPGNLTINASRPSGAPGVNGAGVVYVLTFQAKSAGDSTLVITRPGALNTKQQQVPAQANALTISVK